MTTLKKESVELLDCPRCGMKRMHPVYNSLSRTDNKTDICDNCGTDEAMRDYARQPDIKWANPPDSVIKGQAHLAKIRNLPNPNG